MDLLGFLLVGAVLGVAGQGARIVVGSKKEMAAAKAAQANVEITRSLLLGFAAPGYSGADFFGGLLKRAP